MAASTYLGGRGLGLATVAKYRLGFDTARNAIVIPIFDIRGRCRQLRYRYLSPSGNKYKSETGSGRHLWGIDATLERNVFITEGEFDAMIVRQLGYSCCGYPGTNNFVRSWAQLFRDAEMITVIGDGDDEGRKAMLRIENWLGRVVGDSVRTVEMPSGMDANDLYLKDPDELARRLA